VKLIPAWGIILVIIGAAICCGLCTYGISKAVRRARERRHQDAHAPTRL
jgi:hypothetical protein